MDRNDIPELVFERHVIWDKAQIKDIGGPFELGALQFVVQM